MVLLTAHSRSLRAGHGQPPPLAPQMGKIGRHLGRRPGRRRRDNIDSGVRCGPGGQGMPPPGAATWAMLCWEARPAGRWAVPQGAGQGRTRPSTYRRAPTALPALRASNNHRQPPVGQRPGWLPYGSLTRPQPRGASSPSPPGSQPEPAGCALRSGPRGRWPTASAWVGAPDHRPTQQRQRRCRRYGPAPSTQTANWGGERPLVARWPCAAKAQRGQER